MYRILCSQIILFILKNPVSPVDSLRQWEQKKGMPRVPSMICVKPHLFAITDGGVATCMNAATSELLWQQRVGDAFSASPVTIERSRRARSSRFLLTRGPNRDSFRR